MTHLFGKLTKKLVENLGAGRHGDGNGLYLVVDLSGAQRWIVTNSFGFGEQVTIVAAKSAAF